MAEKETVHGIDLVVVVQVEVRRSAVGSLYFFFFLYELREFFYHKVRLGLHNLFA